MAAHRIARSEARQRGREVNGSELLRPARAGSIEPMRSILVASALVIGAAFAVGAGLGGTAHAQGADLSKAKEHYKAAEAAMAASRFSDAAAEYGMAYEITKDPVLFFKIATADEKAGRGDLAVQ